MSVSPGNEIIKGFIEEVKTYIPSLFQGIESLKKDPGQSQVLEETHRLVHTIKGASSLVGINGLSHIAYQMEETLEDAISAKLALSSDVLRIMSRTIEQFQEYCRGYLKKEIDERAMLKETILAFRRIRGLPQEGDDEALKPLIESIPLSEVAGTETKADAEKAPAMHQVKPSLPPMEMMEDFYEEAEGHLEDMSHSLNILESQIKEPAAISQSLRDVIGRIRRSVHTLKGAAGMVGRKEISKWAHSMEDLLDWIYEEAQEITPEIVTTLMDSGDLLEGFVTRPQDVNPSMVHSLKEKFVEIMPQVFTPEEIGSLLDEPEPMIDMKEILSSISPEFSDEDEEAPEYAPAPGPYPSTRTLRVGMEKVDGLVNLAGELIIALSAFDRNMDVFKNAVDDLELSRDRLRDIAKDMEVGYEVRAIQGPWSTLNLHGVSGGALPVSLLTAASPSPLRQGLPPHPSGRGFSLTPQLEVSSLAHPAGGEDGGGEFQEFDSLELDRYSEFNLIIRTLNESVVDVSAINTQLTNIHSDFDGYLTRQRVLLGELHDKMMRIRMTPMSIITNRMRRTVREVADNLGKKVMLVIEGENIELDRLIWEKVTDPIMHLLRNAVDHGIEPTALRQALGKQDAGTVKVAASREGNQVVIRISDDGAGLNYRNIMKTARMKGLSDKVNNMSEEQLASFIFYPGFSTRDDISEISGRGVGLDVVKQNIQDLKGTLRVHPETGEGTLFIIRIPLTLAVVRGLLFSVEERVFAIDLNEINEILRVNPENIMSQPEESVRIGNEVLPIYRLAKVLNISERTDGKPSTPFHVVVLVIESDGRRRGLVVDSLIGQREIVIKSLGSHLTHVKGISGATIMGDGSVVPILNSEDIFEAGTDIPGIVAPAIEPASVIQEQSLKILIVDDSVSVRQVVSRLMQDQGWETQTAKDGIDALEKLRERQPDLIILDIEMPRMNGYEFMGALKAETGYEDTPVIMLTSRTAKKHREKAKSLGAKGFIVKPYKDDEFINLVLNLTGKSQNA